VSSGTAIVFAKAPEPGRVKTRLQPAFSCEQATGLYAAMLGDVLEATAGFARELGLAAVLALHPWASRAQLLPFVPPAFRVVPQRGRNLAARMTWAIREAAAEGAQRILLRGSDSPCVDLAAFGEALDALAFSDLVLRPDRDGGYGLVALAAPAPGLFDHAMSTSSTLANTLANADALGLHAHVTQASFDIDDVGDLSELAKARSAGRAEACPRTLAYLDDHDLWPDARDLPVF
jgi:hypothetical protein